MHRNPALLLAIALAVPLFGACGADEPVDETAGFDSVTVAGEPGTAPKVTWDGRMSVDRMQSETLVEGDGPELAEGDQALVHLWIGNGYTNQVALDTYEAEKAELVTVGPDVVPAIAEALEGHTIGSRVLVAAPPADAFGDTGNPQLGIGNKDTVVFVVDLASAVLDAPDGKRRPLPDAFPRLTGKDGAFTGWDFGGVPEPDGELHSANLIAGDGPEVEKGDTIAVRYLGQVFGGKKPFDNSYSDADPTTFTVGNGGVIEAWDRVLVGTPVGSRVVMEVPPELGYGKQGNQSAGIKGDQTLYFVVDVLAAA